MTALTTGNKFIKLIKKNTNTHTSMKLQPVVCVCVSAQPVCPNWLFVQSIFDTLRCVVRDSQCFFAFIARQNTMTMYRSNISQVTCSIGGSTRYVELHICITFAIFLRLYHSQTASTNFPSNKFHIMMI